MKSGVKIARSVKMFIGALVAFAAVLTADPDIAMASSGEDIYGGANGLVKDAIEVIRSWESSSDTGASFNMDIEPTVERDLSGTILPGVYVDDIDLSGRSYDEALELINEKVGAMAGATITLNSIEGHSVNVTADELGIKWDDPNTVADALYLGRSGNLVERYKERKDLEHEKVVFPLKLTFDRSIVTNIIAEQGTLYDVEAQDASLEKKDGQFVITEGEKGEKIDVNASVSRVMSNLENFNGSDMTVDLVVIEDVPNASREDLEKIKDVIGSFKTSFKSS